MPKLLYFYRTPLGDFASAGQAARAHRCDRTTIINRCETDPENYRRVPKPPKPKPTTKSLSQTRRTQWPLSWAQYRYLPWETKEAIQAEWLALRGYTQKDMEDRDDVVDQFFDEMDACYDVEDDLDKDCEINL